MSSGLHFKVISVGTLYWTLNVFDSREVSLDRVSRLGLRPYTRYMSSSVGARGEAKNISGRGSTSSALE